MISIISNHSFFINVCSILFYNQLVYVVSLNSIWERERERERKVNQVQCRKHLLLLSIPGKKSLESVCHFENFSSSTAKVSGWWFCISLATNSCIPLTAINAYWKNQKDKKKVKFMCQLMLSGKIFSITATFQKQFICSNTKTKNLFIILLRFQ